MLGSPLLFPALLLLLSPCHVASGSTRNESVLVVARQAGGSNSKVHELIVQLIEPDIDACATNATATPAVFVDDVKVKDYVWKVRRIGEEEKSKVLTITVPLEGERRGAKLMRIESNRCSTFFNYSAHIPAAAADPDGSPLIVLRTDKNVYRPGDLILMRIFLHHLYGIHYKQSVEISIKNSRDRLLAMWSNASSHSVFEEDYLVPVQSPEDDLIISVVTSGSSSVYKKKIEIRKDEAPFNVELQVPEFHSHSSFIKNSSSIHIRVHCSRHSGLPVLGNVTLTMSIRNSSHNATLSPVELENGLKIFNVKRDDLMSSLDLPANRDLVDSVLEVTAHVRETGGKKFVEKKSSTTFVHRRTELEFHPSNQKHFWPGLRYVGFMRLKPKEEARKFQEVKVLVRHLVSAGGEDTWSENVTVVPLSSGRVGRFAVDAASNDSSMELSAFYKEEEEEEEEDGDGDFVSSGDASMMMMMMMMKLVAVSAVDGKNLIQVSLKEDPAIVKNGLLTFHVTASFAAKVVHYEMFAGNLLLDFGSLDVVAATEGHVVQMELPVNSSRSSVVSKLVVWSRGPQGEVASGSLTFVVEHEEEEEDADARKREARLEVEAESSRVNKGQVELQIFGEADAKVYLFSTAIPPIFEVEEWKKEKEAELQRMKRFTNGLVFPRRLEDAPSMCRNCSLVYSLPVQSSELLSESDGVVSMTNIMNEETVKDVHEMIHGDFGDEAKEQRVEFHSSFWRSIQLGPSGSQKIKVPIASENFLYTMSALVVGEKGLSATEPIQLDGSNSVLHEVKYPRRVVEQESFLVEVQLFGGNSRKTNVDVWLKDGPSIAIICDDGSSPSDGAVYQTVEISPLESKSVFFHVNASTPARHEILTELTIDAPPYRVTEVRSLMVDSEDQTTELNVELPNVHEKILNVYGGLMGPAIRYTVESMARPTLRDELTAMRLTISSSSLSQLHDADDVEANEMGRSHLVQNLWKSLQHLFHDQQPDGSFTHSLHGHVSYTSMLLESMLQFEPYVDVEASKVEAAVRYLISRQQEDGSFTERNETQNQKVRLTCRVAISLLKAYKTLDDKETLGKVLEKSLSYLRVAVDSIDEGVIGDDDDDDDDDDDHSLAISSYLFNLLTSDRSERSKILRSNRANLKSSKADSPLEVERVAYDLMVSVTSSDDPDGDRKMAQWLTRRMGVDGRFATPEATMVALRALSVYDAIYRRGRKSKVEIDDSDGDKQQLEFDGPLHVHNINYEKKLNNSVKAINVTLKGEGIVLIQVVITRDLPEVAWRGRDFKLMQRSQPQDGEGRQRREVCIGSSYEEGPLMVEIAIPAGKNVVNHVLPGASLDDSLVHDEIIYFLIDEELRQQRGTNETCMAIELEDEYRMFSRKPRSVQVYSLRNLDARGTLLYQEVEAEDSCATCQCNVNSGSPQRNEVVIIIIKNQNLN